MLGETDEKTKEVRRSFTSQTKLTFLLSEAVRDLRVGFQREACCNTENSASDTSSLLKNVGFFFPLLPSEK